MLTIIAESLGVHYGLIFGSYHHEKNLVRCASDCLRLGQKVIYSFCQIFVVLSLFYFW